jgi:hypothetical protein
MNLEDYINTFSEVERDVVVAQILKSRLLKEAIETPNGKALLGSVVDSIRDKTMSILGSCTAKTKADQTEKIRQAALEIHVMYNLMRNWAEILIDGEKHEEAMKKE